MLKKRVLACVLALLCVFGMASCNTDGTGDEETEQTATSQTTQTTSGEDESLLKIVDGEKSNYKVVYSATADWWAYTTAEYISERITQATGVTPRVASDASEPSDYEIIVGSTNRNDSLGFDSETHDWTLYPIHIGVYGTKILITADKSIDVYKDLSFAMDKWLASAKHGELGISELMCRNMMNAVGSVDDNVITLLMQNLCVWGDAPNTPAERLERVCKEFTYYDADIIGVSEQDVNDWLPYLPSALAPHGYARLGGKKLYGGLDGDWNNIYYKAEKFDVIEWDTFWYSETPDVPGTKLPGAKDKQVATWAIFEVKETGTRFMVMNTHLHAYADYGDIRTQQIEIFTNFLKPYMSQYPVYIMGDMNIEEKHTQYATVLETFNDSRDTAKKNLSGEQDTYNAYGDKEADGDYIFTGKGDKQEILWFKVINEKRFGDYSFGENEWVSDHYGVCVRTRVS
ncbi:MAG: hypothetical protein J6A83_09720 [Clostridia bacterium]|nr:hypothetical protein [Clostridia bacterium]MBP3369988.1 hypothetical protein [Clostridia bacterium]